MKEKGNFMIGLLIAIFVFNLVSFKVNKLLNKKQVAHIWMFTVAFQVVVDQYVDLKYEGYYYFSKDIDIAAVLPITVLVPPVNIVFLNWYPFDSSVKRKMIYILFWVIFMLLYEALALLPEPWGYFNYGWWEFWHSAIADPILLYMLLKYYQWFVK